MLPPVADTRLADARDPDAPYRNEPPRIPPAAMAYDSRPAPRYEAPPSTPAYGYSEPPARSYADAGYESQEVWSPSRYRAALANNR
jgi:hypothetical protein